MLIHYTITPLNMFRTTVCNVNLRLLNNCRIDGGGVGRTSTFDLREFDSTALGLMGEG